MNLTPKWDDPCTPCTENLRSTLCLFWRESESLTDNLDDLSQQHTVAHILLQVFNQPLVSRFGQVVIRPVSVDLSTRKEKSSLRNPSIKKSFTQLGFTTFMQARLTARGLSAASLALYSNPLHCALFSYSSTNNAQILRLTSQKSPSLGQEEGDPEGA